MISTLPTPAAPISAAPGRRPSTGGGRPRSPETLDATTGAFQDHLAEPSAAHERRPDPAHAGKASDESSAQPSSKDGPDAPAAERDDASDPAATSALGSAEAPQPDAIAPSLPAALLPTSPVEPPAGVLSPGTTAPGADTAGENAEAWSAAPLTYPESEIAAASATEAPETGLPPGLTEQAERFPESLLKELAANPAVLPGEQQATEADPVAPQQTAVAALDPEAPAPGGTDGTHDGSQVQAAAPSPAQGEHAPQTRLPAPLPAGNTLLAPQPAAAPLDAGQLATGRAEVVTLPDLPVRLARLAGRVLEAGPSQVRLRLDPPSLGELHIHVGRDENGIHVRIVAQSHETLALLADGQPRLREELARSGLALESFSTAMDDGSQPNADQWTGNMQRDSQNAARRGAPGYADQAAALLRALGPQDRGPGRPRGLDARV
jgi:hypothetical protein